MEEFLQPTAVIESEAAPVVALALELAQGVTDDEVIARRCFLWVRDNVRHSSDCDIPTVTCSASEVAGVFASHRRHVHPHHLACSDRGFETFHAATVRCDLFIGPPYSVTESAPV
jgi:hypothetical protein